jgi:hypothetical protein
MALFCVLQPIVQVTLEPCRQAGSGAAGAAVALDISVAVKQPHQG